MTSTRESIFQDYFWFQEWPGTLWGKVVYKIIHTCDISEEIATFIDNITVGPRLSGHQLSGYLCYPAAILQCILFIFN